MPTPPAAFPRRPEVLLAILLSGCVAALSLQVRRSDGGTTAERWLLEVSGVLVRVVAGARSVAADVVSWSATRGRLLEENAALRSRTVALEAELLRLRDADRESRRLAALLGAVPSPPRGTQPARLIALTTSGPFRSALLDRGREDGLLPGSVVVGVEGLLGRVVGLSRTTARVQLLGDRLSAVGVVLPRTGRLAVARGDGAGGARLEYVPAIADVQPGDLVVSSGTDGVYPRDLPLGTVAEVRRAGAVLFLDVALRLAASPQAEPVVFVLPPPVPADAREVEGPSPGEPAPKGTP
ncbi:MAG: rod shape-determining protein MreC [Acidobacteria bacterium]|nr:MAG: rod shape-determining protein MreC [Acidobacteriota bacterium]